MTPLAVVRHAVIALAIALVLGLAFDRPRLAGVLPRVLMALAGVSAVMLIALVANHVRYPFNLDLLETVLLQQARQVIHGESVYPVPSPEYVPLAYNALFYFVVAPFLLLFGDTLITMRMVAVCGLAGCALAIFLLVRDATRSSWWGAIATGLFCAACASIAEHLDSAHADAWLVCCALWGTYLLARETRTARIGGVVVLVAAFWFKQHGAIFCGAGLVYLTWREGVRSLPYWLIALVLGPILYIVAPFPALGTDFHFFTWHVPSGWSQFTAHAIPRLLFCLAIYYPVLTLAALAGVWRALRSRTLGIFELMFGAALLTGFLGTLDIGSSYNVFIPMGTFCIVYGTIALARFSDSLAPWHGLRLPLIGALLSFAALLDDPRPYWLPSTAAASYADLKTTIGALPGTVYAPGIGQLAEGPKLYPAVHWVALDDIMRGPHRSAADSVLARSLLDPLRHPTGVSYVLTNDSLKTMPAPVNELASSYALVTDYGTRFQPLTGLPARWSLGWPRYLYRYAGAGAPNRAP